LRLQLAASPMSVRSLNSFSIFFLTCIKVGAGI
jgi:hypothetical protein